MRRALITWTIVAAVVIAAFAGTVSILNSTLYSPSGFVKSYLDALSSKDAAIALELAGSGERSTASRAMLDPAAMGDLDDIEFVSESSFAFGVQRVVFSYVAGGKAGQSSFDVQRTGKVLGLFSSWSFVTAPYSVVKLSVLNSQEFTANGVDLTTPEEGTAVPLVVFTPTAVSITHDSTFLTANPLLVVAAQPGSSVVAALEVRANSAFIDKVQGEIDGILDACAAQPVLQPTGCPFGQEISNRIASTPEWSISKYPAVAVVPATEPGAWQVPVTNSTARLTVDVQSLFDGTTSRFDEDVPFTVSYLVTFLTNDEVLITPLR